jgi:Repulsive guidance molecule (RGM) C-terminus
MEARNFDGHQDLFISVRTSFQDYYSYIEAAAIQIGEDVLEVGAYGNYGFNGVDTPDLGEMNASIGGYALFHKQVTKIEHTYDIVLGPNENITLASYKHLVSIEVNAATAEKYFVHAVGIIGSINGDLLNRSGKVMNPEEDEAAYGQEWQITDKEPQLFRIQREPQHPAKCEMRTRATSPQRRRLGETMAEEVAKKACAHKKGAQFHNCVFDVMATGDLELAQSGAY